MTQISDIIGRVIALDPESQRSAILSGLLARTRAMDAFVAKPGRRDAFIMIEKVTSKEPVALFGQDVGSLAFSRVSIFEGRQQNGAWVAGDHMISFDISDHALTTMILKCASGTPQPMTVSRIDGVTLPPYASDKSDFEAMMNDQANAIFNRYADALRVARDAALSGGRPGAGHLGDILGAMNNLNRRDDMDFVLQQHIRNLGRLKTTLEYEIIGAATQAGLPRLAQTAPADMDGDHDAGIDGGIDRSASPVWDALCGLRTPEEAVALIDGIDALKEILLGDEDAHDRTTDQHKAVQSLISLRRSLSNIAALKGASASDTASDTGSKLRCDAQPRECGGRITHVQGGSRDDNDPFCDDGHSIRLYFESVSSQTSYGTVILDSIENLMTIDMTPDNFMSALRDGALGHKTPCAISSIFRRGTAKAEKPASEYARIMATLDADMIRHEEKIRALTRRLEALVNETSLTKKADRQAAAAIVEEALQLYDAYQKSAEGAIAGKAVAIETLIRDGVREKLSKMHMIGDEIRAAAAKLITST